VAAVLRALARLAKIDDCPDAFSAQLLPALAGDPVDVLGPVKHFRGCRGAVAAAQPAEVSAVDQPLDAERSR